MNKVNFLTAATLLLLGVSAFLGYRVYELIHPKPTPPPCPVSYNYSDGESVGVINYETAQALYNNYQKDRGKAFISGRDTTGKLDGFIQDANSVWFSLDRLKNFLWQIEEQNCKKPCQDTLGLRIYFAKYPDLNNLTDKSLLGLDEVPKNYSNHHTLFMVPTYRGKDGYEYDFYPGGEGCRTPLVSSPTENYGSSDLNLIRHKITPSILLFDMAPPPPGGSQNHGGLVPPNDPTGTSFQ